MEKTTLDDKAMLNDLLITCKQRMSAYSTLIAETTCPNLRTMLQDLFVEAAEDQYAIFDFMHKQGWYPVKQAKQEDITQAKEKAEQLKTRNTRPYPAAFLFVVIFHQDIQRHRAAFFHHLSAA